MLGLTLSLSLLIVIFNGVLSNAIFDIIMRLRGTHYLEGESKSKEIQFIVFVVIVPFSLIVSFAILLFYNKRKLLKKE